LQAGFTGEDRKYPAPAPGGKWNPASSNAQFRQYSDRLFLKLDQFHQGFKIKDNFDKAPKSYWIRTITMYTQRRKCDGPNRLYSQYSSNIHITLL